MVNSNILTPAEAATALRCDETDQNMLDLLDLVDDYIETATGRDWTVDETIDPKAKSAARMLLVRWHEDPGGIAAGTALAFGLQAVLTQLEGRALELATDGAPDEMLALMQTNIAYEMAVDASIVLVFNHALASGATAKVRLESPSGSIVATTNSLSATGKILTIKPTSSLAKNTTYTVVLDHPADIYGQALDTELTFTTED